MLYSNAHHQLITLPAALSGLLTLTVNVSERPTLIFTVPLQGTHSALAEKEFKTMKAKFSYYEHRYEYGLFLGRAGRLDEAKQVFEEIVGEASHLSSREKRDANIWFAQAKDALKKMRA